MKRILSSALQDAVIAKNFPDWESELDLALAVDAWLSPLDCLMIGDPTVTAECAP